MTAQHYRPPEAQRAIDLGNLYRQGYACIIARTKRAIADHGRIALFIGRDGQAAACSWRHEDIERNCRVHAKSLVGVYQLGEDGNVPPAAEVDIEADIELHMLALRRQAWLRNQTRRAA